MPFVTRFTKLLVNMVKPIEIRQISPEHIRVWIRILNPSIKIEAIPDPEDPEVIDTLQGTIDDLLCDFLDLLLCKSIAPGQSPEALQDVMRDLFDLNVAIDLVVRAAVARQKQGDEGWVYISIHFMRAIAEGFITPDTLELFLLSTTPRTTSVLTIDA